MCHCREDFGSVISVTSLQVVVSCFKMPPWLPPGRNQQSQLSLSQLILPLLPLWLCAGSPFPSSHLLNMGLTGHQTEHGFTGTAPPVPTAEI